MKIIVARYNEDTSWTKDYKDVFVVQKGEHIDNWGREPSSFIWYIINHYDELDGYYCFLQAKPFEHFDGGLVDWVPEGTTYFPLGDSGFISTENGQPFDNVPVRDVALALGLGINKWPIQFTRGGQFIVHARFIKNKPLWWWEHALDVMKNTHRGEYCFERLWQYIFEKEM